MCSAKAQHSAADALSRAYSVMSDEQYFIPTIIDFSINAQKIMENHGKYVSITTYLNTIQN